MTEWRLVVRAHLPDASIELILHPPTRKKCRERRGEILAEGIVKKLRGKRVVDISPDFIVDVKIERIDDIPF